MTDHRIDRRTSREVSTGLLLEASSTGGTEYGCGRSGLLAGWSRSGLNGSSATTGEAMMVQRHDRSESGITTAEYAVGTAAGAGLAGLLYKMLSGGFGEQLLKTLFDHVLGLLGLG